MEQKRLLSLGVWFIFPPGAPSSKSGPVPNSSRGSVKYRERERESLGARAEFLMSGRRERCGWEREACPPPVEPSSIQEAERGRGWGRACASMCAAVIALRVRALFFSASLRVEGGGGVTRYRHRGRSVEGSMGDPAHFTPLFFNLSGSLATLATGSFF